MLKHFADWLLKDKEDRIVIAQWPNVWLLGWATAAIVAHFVHASAVHTTVSLIGKALLLIWAYLEVTKGSSNIRRILGGLIALATIWTLLQQVL